MTHKILIPALAMLLVGCVHVNESSTTAKADQIRERMAHQLGCATLELVQKEPNVFFGSGNNEQGAFTIVVRREKGKINYQGSYLEPGKGRFGGSMSWEHSRNAWCGFHKEKHREETTVTSTH